MANNRYVEVNITRKTQATTQAGFGTPLLVSTGTAVPLTTLNAANALTQIKTLFGTDSREYNAVSTMLQQSPRVSQIKVLGVVVTAPMTKATAVVDALTSLETDYFYLLTTERDAEVIRAIAQFNETQDKLFVFSTDLDTVTTTIADLSKTVALYHTKASTEFLDAAAIGYMAPREIGTYVLAFKTMVGITPDSLSLSRIEELESKNYNCYITQSGISMVSDAKTASGEYVDNVQVTLWLDARITESIFNLLATTPKVPYVQSGLDLVGHTLSMVFENAPDGMFDTDESGNAQYTVTVPPLGTIPQNDIMNRILNGVSFTADVAGAIQKITIDGTLFVAS